MVAVEARVEVRSEILGGAAVEAAVAVELLSSLSNLCHRWVLRPVVVVRMSSRRLVQRSQREPRVRWPQSRQRLVKGVRAG